MAGGDWRIEDGGLRIDRAPSFSIPPRPFLILHHPPLDVRQRAPITQKSVNSSTA
jgi:hypothetical protein